MNCGSEVIPAVRVVLFSNCTNSPCFKESTELKYQWSLFSQKHPPDSSWSEVHQMQTITGTSLNTSNLVINPNTLIAGRDYRLIVYLENVNGEDSNGFAVWLFKTSTIPADGTCTANTSSGVAVGTAFTLSCANWYDANAPLLYELVLPLADGLSTILSYRYSTVVEVVLPPGDPMENYTLTIETVVTSSIGSRANTSINVKVSY